MKLPASTLIKRYESTAETFEEKGKRNWAYAKNGKGGQYYAIARDAFEKAKINREKAETLKQQVKELEEL